MKNRLLSATSPPKSLKKGLFNCSNEGWVCLGIGKAFDEVIPGSGSSLTNYGTLAFVILIILAVALIAGYILSQQ